MRPLLALAVLPSLVAQVPVPAPYQGRLAALESVLDRFYRGESLAAGHARVNALVDAFNAQVKQGDADLQAAKAQVDQALAPAKELAPALDAQDKALAKAPDPGDREATRRFNAQVDARNALADRYNALVAAGQREVDAYNARLQRQNQLIAQSRAGLEAERRALKERTDAYEAFQAQGQDLAFFTALNQLLADLRAATRSAPEPGTQAALDKVRALRRELALWAAERQSAQANGLVLVNALVGDEPCCFIVDTGAQLVCLPRELIDALGLTGSLGEEATLTLAGGQKIRGRAIDLPQVAVGNRARTAVAGSAVPASDVGIDGLLGQSFLKGFVYTIDEGRPGKLVLEPR